MARGNLPVINPPPRNAIATPDGRVTPLWAHWFELLHNRVGEAAGHTIIGGIAVFEETIGQAALASAAAVTVLLARSGERWKIREVFLSGGGTNFSGGDRLLSIGDGTAIYTVIPAATLQSLAPARWGDTGTPYPATAAHLTLASDAGINVTAQYSGGATDYTAGACTIVITAERLA